MEAHYFILILWLLILVARRYGPGSMQGEARRDRSLDARRGRELARALEHTTEPSADPSFFQIIRRQAQAHPNEPIIHSEFPPIPSDEEGAFYFAGARDIFDTADRVQGQSWRDVVAIVRAANRGWVKDPAVVEAAIRSIEPIRNMDAVLAELITGDVSPRVCGLFMDMARTSRNYAAVKWGIIVAGLRPEAASMPDILLLARHSEFTLYVCQILLREIPKSSEYREHLIGLLPVTEGWGACQTINFVLRNLTPPVGPDIAQTAVINGMNNGAGARAQIAAIIEESIDLLPMLETARHDALLAEALLELLGQLLWEPKPSGMLHQTREGSALIRGYLKLIESLPTSVNNLHLLWGIGSRLSDADITWPDRDDLLTWTRSVFLVKLSRDIIVDAIRNDEQRLAALQLAVVLEMHDIVPVILDDLRRHADPANVDAVGQLGDESAVAALLSVLPSSETLAEREATERITADEAPVDTETMMYGVAVQHIGKLNSRRAIEHIRRAAGDPHPFVRAAAMSGLENMQRWTLDNDMKRMVREALADPSETVRAAAERAAAHHTLQASINRRTGSFPMDVLGLSAN